MAKQEEFILTVAERGFGKRSSAYSFRIAGRGGSGIWAMKMTEKNGKIVASFPIKEGQDIILVTNGGQVIRMPVAQIRIAGRATQGVTVFRVDESEKVVSVTALGDEGGQDA